ncbi:MAG: NAD(+) synthase, partial [Planctomycetota bacterium]
MDFHKDILKLDAEHEVDRICSFIVQQVREVKRDGIIVGLSGGIDSALCAALCVRALGADKVFGLILPEKESNSVSAEYATRHAKELGIRTETVDITPTLEAFGTYQKRDDMIREVFPEYDSASKSKITLPADLLSKDSLNFFTLRVDDGKGNIKTARLNKKMLNGI